MTFAARTLLFLTLTLPVASSALAQATATEGTTAVPTSAANVTSTAAAEAAAPEAQSSYETRSQFTSLLRQSPSELPAILVLDPTLLENEAFMARYPGLARFVADHPEVRHHPGFYLADFNAPRPGNPLGEALEPLGIFTIFALIVGWLVRTIIEQKRWNRLSRTQSEVHNKILDRFGTTTELLEYIRTPAGTKFLESAPIPLHTEQPSQNLPAARVMWSIQIGVVVAAAAIGLLIVSGRFQDESGQGLFAMGVIALCIGGGFIASAAVSLFLSRRLGLWQAPGGNEITDSGPVR